MDNRLDAGARRVGAGVHVREQADHGAVAGRAEQCGGDVAVVVERDIAEARLGQFLHQHASQVELTGGAGRPLTVAG